MAYERVYTVSNYYDGPREGIADYQGRPHKYVSQWDHTADDWANTFELTLVDAESFNLEMERWQIWQTWERVFHAGEVAKESHPAFGGKNVRYDELGKLIASRMLNREPLDGRFTGNFRAARGQETSPGFPGALEVEWSVARR